MDNLSDRQFAYGQQVSSWYLAATAKHQRKKSLISTFISDEGGELVLLLADLVRQELEAQRREGDDHG